MDAGCGLKDSGDTASTERVFKYRKNVTEFDSGSEPSVLKAMLQKSPLDEVNGRALLLHDGLPFHSNDLWLRHRLS